MHAETRATAPNSRNNTHTLAHVWAGEHASSPASIAAAHVHAPEQASQVPRHDPKRSDLGQAGAGIGGRATKHRAGTAETAWVIKHAVPAPMRIPSRCEGGAPASGPAGTAKHPRDPSKRWPCPPTVLMPRTTSRMGSDFISMSLSQTQENRMPCSGARQCLTGTPRPTMAGPPPFGCWEADAAGFSCNPGLCAGLYGIHRLQNHMHAQSRNQEPHALVVDAECRPGRGSA